MDAQKDRTGQERSVRLALGALGFLPVVLWAWYFWAGHVGLPPDAQTYLAAGERLNAGHSLYGALGPGDRPVLDAASFAAPLLSPPLIAVLWRPLAALGEWTAWVWWAVAVVALLGTLITLWIRSPLATGALVVVLSVPLAIECGVANLDSFIIPGFVAAWWLWRAEHPGAAMSIAVLLSALKLVPVFLVVWLLAVAPRTTWRPALVAACVCAAVSLAGAGLTAHIDYLQVLSTTSGGRGGEAYIATAFALAIVVARRHPAAGYCLATLAVFALWNQPPVMAILAPLAWRQGLRVGVTVP